MLSGGIAPIAQLAEAADLKSAQCRFESDWGHEIRPARWPARSAPCSREADCVRDVYAGGRLIAAVANYRVESMRSVVVVVDIANWRLTQIPCGPPAGTFCDKYL